MATNYIHEDEVVEGDYLITAVVVGTTATPLPATPRPGRNVLVVHNPDVTGAIRILLCNADGTGAIPVDPGDPPVRKVTRDESSLFYAKAAAPTTVQIEEWR